MVEAFGLKQRVGQVERIEQRQGLVRDFVNIAGQADHLEVLGERQRAGSIVGLILESELDHLHGMPSFLNCELSLRRRG